MKTKVRYLTILFTCSIMVLIVSGSFALGAGNRPMISDAERAVAALQVQNTYSKHAYYHTIGANCEEMADIWVKQDGPYAKTATWTSAMGIWEGFDLIKEYYCTYNLKSKQKNLDAISEIYPEVKNVPENLGVGYGYTIHTQTTPIIEIAGDGKTAKGLWYSPGISTNVAIIDGKAETVGGWFFEKYAVDFVKEDGEWKIWHIGMYYDQTPPGWGAERQREPVVQTGEQAETLEMVKPTRPNPDPYKGWSPTWVPRIYPRFPEPYYTFSETFAY
ncbi:nuclear transport factor 2 family protein [Deltaproteobacteria bacterium]|nr:nuclear transport factor 2 family protein [Deltaproteobacteria bacterium]